MLKKLVEIVRCPQCPHYVGQYEYRSFPDPRAIRHANPEFMKRCAKMEMRQIDDDIPDWCPLPDIAGEQP